MGRPMHEGGLNAMKGPTRAAVPQMARNFDVEMAARKAGILGMVSQESGHFLASPAPQLARRPQLGHRPQPTWRTEDYVETLNETFVRAADDPRSTFSVDVDTGTYSLVRRGLVEFQSLPSPATVRIEEMINYFDYDYPEPSGEVPLSIVAEVGPCPWDSDHRLVHLGLQGKHVALGEVPPRNLVFLIDVSGSMSHALPLVVSSLEDLSEQLGERDTIAIVVYAGAAGIVLPPTRGSERPRILEALHRLEAGGSTNGGEGIELAYRLAREHFVEGGINRVMLATDGDFNVGVVGRDALVELIEAKRRSGVFLSVLGLGGSNYQDVTMEQLADEGNGNYAYIDGPAEARKVLVEQAGATLVTIAKDVKIQVSFDPVAVQSYRLVGYDNRVLAHEDFEDDTKDAGEIGAGHTVTALYEIVPEAGAPEGDALMNLELRYKPPESERSRLVQVPVRDEGLSLAETSSIDCEVSPAPSVRYADPLQVALDPDADEGGFDWAKFVVEVLYLLPPLLALPLFFIALRRPRRRRS